jgi:serine/threonine protein kinase
MNFLARGDPLLTTAHKMILGRPYNSAIEWWQLGIMNYQMLTQRSPFQGEDEDDIYDSILADEPFFPTYMSTDATDFIQGLLTREPMSRLGSGIYGADGVMAHEFFTDINWDILYRKQVPAPFIPTVASRTDVSNFDPEFTHLDPQAIVDIRESMFI